MSVTYNLLIDLFSGGNTDCIKREKEFDWEEAFSILKRHKLLNLFYDRYSSIIPHKLISTYAVEAYRNRANNMARFNELCILKNLFAQEKMDFILLC